MKDEIIDSLGNCNNKKCDCDSLNDAFISLNLPQIFIIDDEDSNPIKLHLEESSNQIRITNKVKQFFTVVKIDNCLICNDVESKCDGVIFNKNSFYFLEIKNPKRKGKSQAKSKAYKQLEFMIEKFQNINFNKRKLFAVIGFPTPKYSIVGARSNAQKSRFKDDFKKQYGMSVNLMEGHEIILS